MKKIHRMAYTISCMVCVMTILILMSGCQTKKKHKVTATEVPNSSITYVKGPDFVGVIRKVDTQGQRITFYNTLLETQEEYPYSGGTKVLSKNDRDMSMEEVSVGEVYDVTCDKKSGKISEIHQSKDILELEDVEVSVDADNERLTVDDVNYAYSNQLVVVSDGRLMEPLEIMPGDKVIFRGVKGQAYSVVVTRGHGYIQPTHYKDFIGGKLTVKGEAIVPVTQGMLLTVPEGTQSLEFINGDLTSSSTVTVKRGKVTKFNVAKYQTQMPDTSRVTFDISPQGAELYINGNLTDYSKPVSMKYGNHSVKVVLEGYQDYSGVIQVKDSSATVKIDLAEESADMTQQENSSSDTSSDDSTKDQSSTAQTTTYDKDHTVTVSAPQGAAVYVDGTYKGEVPCSFTKMIGKVTVTLSKEGYTTKSYRVELPDDSQNITWSFPDLTQESQG